MRRSITRGFLATGLAVAVVLMVAARPNAHVSVGAPIEPGDATDDSTTTTTDATTTSTTTPPSTSTTTSTTTTAAPSAATSSTIARPSGPTPATAVTASNTIAGAGGTISFTGSCPATDFGALVARITGTVTELVDTGITTSTWTWSWTAPTDTSLIGSFEFEFWCGDPSGATGLPPAPQHRVDMVASAPTPTTNTTTTITTSPAAGAPAVSPVTATLPRTR